MANTQLAKYQDLAFGELNQQDIVTIRETIGKDCNESQFKLFMSIAKSSGANPIVNEIYPTVRQNQLTIQFGIDFFVRKAKESDGFQGYDVQLVHENDAFKMHQEKDDNDQYFIVIDEHSWGFPRGKVIGGYAIAYREGMKPFTVIMEVDEVEHFKRSNIGMQKTMWTNYFNDMFKKHMVRRALKAAYNLNFDEEVAVNDDSIPEYKPTERKDITPQQEVIDKPAETEEEKQKSQLRNSINNAFKKLGITGKKATAEYIKTHVPDFDNDNPSLSNLNGLLRLLEMNIEMNEFNSDKDELE